MNADAAISTVRREWMYAIRRQCQLFVARAVATRDIEEFPALADDLLRTLPDSETRAEHLALHALLTTMAAKWASFAHRRAHDRRDVGCAFVPARTLDRFWTDSPDAIKGSFAEWATAFSRELHRAHPPALGERAAQFIRRHCASRCDTRSVAAALNVGVDRLRRAFEADFEMTIGDYIRRVRVLVTLERLAGTNVKIEPVMLDAGYKNRSNFNRVVEAIIGMTPRQFRQLPPASAIAIVGGVRRSIEPRRARAEAIGDGTQSGASPLHDELDSSRGSA